MPEMQPLSAAPSIVTADNEKVYSLSWGDGQHFQVVVDLGSGSPRQQQDFQDHANVTMLAQAPEAGSPMGVGSLLRRTMEAQASQLASEITAVASRLAQDLDITVRAFVEGFVDVDDLLRVSCDEVLGQLSAEGRAVPDWFEQHAQRLLDRRGVLNGQRRHRPLFDAQPEETNTLRISYRWTQGTADPPVLAGGVQVFAGVDPWILRGNHDKFSPCSWDPMTFWVVSDGTSPDESRLRVDIDGSKKVTDFAKNTGNTPQGDWCSSVDLCAMNKDVAYRWEGKWWQTMDESVAF